MQNDQVNPEYLVRGDKMFVYKLAEFDEEANVAHLILFKNLADFQADKPYQQIQVAQWQ